MQHQRGVSSTDNDLSDYIAHIKYGLSIVADTQQELSKWWNPRSDGPSDLARSVRREHQFRDGTIRLSLKTTAIVSYYMILEDRQSKNLANIERDFRNGPLGTIITQIYSPLWQRFLNRHGTDLQRLRINRNNLYAHISRGQHINDVLQYSEATASKFADIAPSDHFTRGLTEDHTIIENSDVLGEMALFSHQSLEYLQQLLGLLSLSQEPTIQSAIEADPESHIIQFIENNPLPQME